MKKRRRKIHFKLNITKIVILVSMLIAVLILGHDFIFWAIKPIFTGTFYELTYTGLFVDLICAFVLESGTQYIKEI